MPVSDLNPPRRVLFACIGNICRSPMAAGLAAKFFPAGFHFESVGVQALTGLPAHEHAVEVMREYEVDISGHRSRGLEELSFTLGHYHRVVALEAWVARILHSMTSGLSLVAWEIEDPYGGNLEAYRDCARRLAACLQGQGGEW